MSSLYRPLPDDALRIVAKGRKRTCLPRACTYKVVSCRAGTATRRNREGLARAPPLEGHDNARVLMHSYHPIVASWVFEKIVSFAHPLWFLKTAHARDLIACGAKVLSARARGQRKRRTFQRCWALRVPEDASSHFGSTLVGHPPRLACGRPIAPPAPPLRCEIASPLRSLSRPVGRWDKFRRSRAAAGRTFRAPARAHVMQPAPALNVSTSKEKVDAENNHVRRDVARRCCGDAG
jgi:hypothetical protein